MTFNLGRSLSRIRQTISGNNYWKERKDLLYYKLVVALAREFAPRALSVIDVGSADTRVLDSVDWIPHKFALDRYFCCRPCDATYIQADFMDFRPTRQFDLVFCLQVLEHLEDPMPFAKKLLSIGAIIIVSVPYQWPKGFCKWHVQDPVDESKLLGWFGKPFVKSQIVDDAEARRLAVVLLGDAGHQATQDSLN
jgi:hypothetical protein